jgi:hypothetical protein|tara:strand:+ start:304 stop:426 length:123 start_codon:yes stop_codon:yes gene_type:complete
MPQVGTKKYSYNKKGMAAAKKEAKATGKPMQNLDKYKKKK